MRKIWKAAAAGLFLSLAWLMVSVAEEPAEGNTDQPDSRQEINEEWQWQEDYDGWKYKNTAGEYKKNCWEQIDGYWYYFNHDGYMASDWTKIGRTYYCFEETGELAVGWRFEEENEKWHYYHEDGTAQKGWYESEDGSWYWFSSRGEMASSGYKNIEGKRYYFLENGQLAANQYVGLNYMDENGQRNREFDILIEGKKNSSAISAETKEAITEALKDIPRHWIKDFNEKGWQILYYPDKEFFSAPLTGSGTYFVCHKLDTSYQKIKVCKPEALTAAFGEYIGYASGCYGDDSREGTDLFMNKDMMQDFVYVPDYYEDDIKFYFGKLVEAYLSGPAMKSEMESAAPEVTDILKSVLNRKPDTEDS